VSATAKTAAFTAFVVVSNVAGNSVINWGIKSEQWLIAVAGVVLLIAWLLARMTLLSWADLSWVLPVTAIGYVLSALAGRWFFDEQVTGWRWLGTAMIAAGAALVGFQDHKAGAQ
jgi:uncharacterized membrane protein